MACVSSREFAGPFMRTYERLLSLMRVRCDVLLLGRFHGAFIGALSLARLCFAQGGPRTFARDAPHQLK